MRFFSFVVAAFLVAFCVSCFAISVEDMAQLENMFAQGRSKLNTMTEKEQKTFSAFEKYYEAKKQDLLSGKKPAVNNANKKRTTITESFTASINLKNGNQFRLRHLYLVDFTAIITNILGSICQDFSTLCDTLLADILPGIYFIESFDGRATNASGNFDLFSHLIVFPSSDTKANEVIHDIDPELSIYPSNVVSYFSVSDQYTLTYDTANLEFSGQAFAALHTYTNIIEYNDKNGNKAYDAGEEVQFYNLASIGWTTSYNKITVGQYTVHEFIGTTNDNVVTFTCHTSDYPVIDQNGAIIHPNGTKCNIEISNFNFTGTGDYLALEAYTISGEGTYQGSESASVSITPANSNSIGGYYNWVATAKSSGNSININSNVTGVTNGPTSVGDFAAYLTVTSSGTTDVRRVIFSFQSSTNPSLVYWDPSVGYGNPPQTSSATSLIASVLVIALAFLALLF